MNTELRKELERMKTVIDELIKPQVEKYEQEQKEVTKRKLSLRPQIESKVSFSLKKKVYFVSH